LSERLAYDRPPSTIARSLAKAMSCGSWRRPPSGRIKIFSRGYASAFRILWATMSALPCEFHRHLVDLGFEYLGKQVPVGSFPEMDCRNGSPSMANGIVMTSYLPVKEKDSPEENSALDFEVRPVARVTSQTKGPAENKWCVDVAQNH